MPWAVRTNVMKRYVALMFSGHVDFDHDETRQNVCRREEKIAEFCNASLARLSDSQHGLRVIFVGETISGCCDYRQHLANKATARWHYTSASTRSAIAHDVGQLVIEISYHITYRSPRTRPIATFSQRDLKIGALGSGQHT